MAKRFEYADIGEMWGYNLEDACKFKSKHLVSDTIEGARKDGYDIICVGPQGSGKSFVMRLVLKSMPSFNPEETMDEASNGAVGDNIKYWVMRLYEGEDVVSKIRERTGKHAVHNTLIVYVDNKCITKVQAVRNELGDLVLEDVVCVDSGRYAKA